MAHDHADLPELYTAREVAACLRVRIQTVYELVERGELPCRRLGPRLLRFTAKDVDALLQRPDREAIAGPVPAGSRRQRTLRATLGTQP